MYFVGTPISARYKCSMFIGTLLLLLNRVLLQNIIAFLLI